MEILCVCLAEIVHQNGDGICLGLQKPFKVSTPSELLKVVKSKGTTLVLDFLFASHTFAAFHLIEGLRKVMHAEALDCQLVAYLFTDAVKSKSGGFNF